MALSGVARLCVPRGVADGLTRAIINFHGLGPQPASIDAGEAHVWCTDPGLYAALLDETREVTPDHLITFDDGNRSDIELGLRPLADRGMSAIFFPCAGRIGTPGYLDQAALRALVGAGMGIGSHGWSHVDWRRAGSAMHREVVEAKDRIEQAAGVAVTSVAIPFGSYDRKVLARAAPFTTIYTSDAALADPAARLQPRFSYARSWSPGTIAAIVAQARRPTRRVRQKLAMTFKRFR